MDVERPFERHPHYEETLERIRLVDTLIGGSSAMRKAGEEYLPRYEGESANQYGARIKFTRLAPLYRSALKFHADRVFEEPVKVKSGAVLPRRWEEIERDIDGNGASLQSFAYRFFKLGEHHGIAHILVDGSRTPGAAEFSRGYLRIISAKQLFNWRRERGELVEIRISERTEDGEEACRIIRPDEWAVFRKRDGLELESGPWSLGYIPLNTWKADPDLEEELDEFVAAPYLEDVAELNLQHWRSHSTQENALHLARRPKYIAKGLGKNWAATMGGSMLITVNFDEEDAETQAALLSAATFEAVSEDTGPITVGYTDLDRIVEEAARTTGQSLINDQPGTRTATEKALDTAEASCGVQRLTNGSGDAINAALFDLGQFSGTTMLDTVELNQDVGINVNEDLEAVWRLATDLGGVMGVRSREMVIDEHLRRGVISPSTDTDGLLEEAEEAANEADRTAEGVLERARRIAAEQGDEDGDTSTILAGLRNSEVDES